MPFSDLNGSIKRSALVVCVKSHDSHLPGSASKFKFCNSCWVVLRGDQLLPNRALTENKTDDVIILTLTPKGVCKIVLKLEDSGRLGLMIFVILLHFEWFASNKFSTNLKRTHDGFHKLNCRLKYQDMFQQQSYWTGWYLSIFGCHYWW